MELCIHLYSSPARIGVSVKTNPFLDRQGILPAKRTITSRRYYTDSDLAAVRGLPRLRSGAKAGFRESKRIREQ